MRPSCCGYPNPHRFDAGARPTPTPRNERWLRSFRTRRPSCGDSARLGPSMTGRLSPAPRARCDANRSSDNSAPNEISTHSETEPKPSLRSRSTMPVSASTTRVSGNGLCDGGASSTDHAARPSIVVECTGPVGWVKSSPSPHRASGRRCTTQWSSHPQMANPRNIVGSSSLLSQIHFTSSPKMAIGRPSSRSRRTRRPRLKTRCCSSLILTGPTPGNSASTCSWSGLTSRTCTMPDSDGSGPSPNAINATNAGQLMPSVSGTAWVRLRRGRPRAPSQHRSRSRSSREQPPAKRSRRSGQRVRDHRAYRERPASRRC